MDTLELQILKGFVLKKNRAYIIAHPEITLTPIEQQTLDTLVQQRKAGVPIAYLLGEKEFWSMTFKVNASVLIPRPETELLVETLLATIPTENPQSILELGTGSGVISIVIAKERPHWHITATDNCSAALSVAKENAKHHDTTNIRFLKSDWFSALDQRKFHAIISNPPYIPTGDDHLQKGDLRFEPKKALASGEEGLNAIREILQKAGHFLHPAGLLFLEHGFDQAEKIRAIFLEQGFYQIVTENDLSGLPRITYGKVAA